MPLFQETFDVIISGAGPAGSATALALANSGLKIALLDKSEFPRDKICGDALSVDVLNQLPMLSESLANDFREMSLKTEIPGIRIVSPGGSIVDLPFLYHGKPMSGYVSKRTDFDALLQSHAKALENVRWMPYHEVKGAETDSDGVQVQTSQGVITGKVVVAADGAQSRLARRIQPEINRRHHSAGLRVYYRNVGQMHEKSFIELIFFKDVLPGYVWIFPLPEGRANVGIGILSETVVKKKLNLRAILEGLLTTHPDLKDRFRNAEAEETMKGFGLPLGTVHRAISAERVLLTGDAAGLIDPFSGEGIGNALRSGRKAAATIIEAFESGDFSAPSMQRYDREVFQAMGKEFKVSRALQRACKNPRLFDWIARKASDPYWHAYLMDALTDMHKKNRLTDPRLYLKMLVK